MTSSAIKDIFKKLKNRDRKSKAIMLIAFSFVALATVMVGLLINHKKNNSIIAGDSELRRAINYDLFEDGDDTVEDIEGNVIDSIKFGAFFLRDVDGDGYADRIKGTCKEIGKEDTLYMELNVQTEGKLVNGKIEIGGESFQLQTTLPKDNVIKENYIGNNIKTIKFNDIENGTQTMISGIIHAGDYNSYSSKFSALGNNVNKYSTNNTVVLTGTYVVENLDGTTTETEIRKEIDLEIDWYGTAEATLSGTSQSRTNVGITNTETNELNLGFYLQPTETKNELILKDNSLTAEIPLLNGYEPIRVSATGTNINYSYDELTRIITITKEAELDENGKVIKNAYSSYSSSQRYNTYNISVIYPLEAYEVMGEGSTIELKVPVTTYFEGYNNPNSEFSNPFKTNIATATYTIRYQKPAEQTSNFRLEIGKYMYRPSSRYVISKKKPLRIYNELSSEEKDDIYEVRWIASTGTNGEYTGIVMKETPDGADRLKDEFVKADNSLDSMENITSNIGIYFSNATSMLGDGGWIKVYDDETDNLIATFTQSDWNRYTSSNVYYYDVPIKHVRIETSSTNALSSMTVYHIKELDDEYITENYTKDEFDKLNKIKTNLVGYLGDTKITTTSNTANYEAPYAIADISIDKNTISTQSTEKNEIITIKAVKDESLNQLGWTNGSFLIKVPQDILDLEINSVSINNSNVRILSYENYEEDGINYIKIITANEQEESYSITVDCNITPDPRIASSTETFELYASCDNAEEYYYSSQDIYDVNGNLNTNELVNKRATNINLIAPSSLLTNQTAHNYDDAGTIVIAPKVAILDKERRFATVSVEVKNNYTSTISEVSVLGRIPFEGNRYVINGKDMGSNYSTTMTNDGISLPQELQDIAVVYYSENGNASKDLSLEANGWTTEVSDFSKIKSYMIVLEDYALAIGESHVVSYEINIPEGLSYNQVSYSHHAVFFSLDTPEGKYRTQTEPNKIGFMIAKQYDLEVIKYQKDTEKTLSEVTFSIQEEGEEEAKTKVTGIDGTFRINGLYLDRTYTIKEIKGPTSYELNEEEIKFIGTEDNTVLDVSLISGNPKVINAFQPHDGEDYKIQVQVEDEVRAKFRLIKKEAGTGDLVSKVKFKITGKGFGDSGRIITTNSSGEANISGLYIGEEYRLEETKAEGYYLASPINFKIENNSGNYSANILEGEIESQSTALNDYIPTINVELENEKIPTYDLEITKIKKRTNVETSNDPSNPGAGNEEITYLQGAKFKLYKNGKELGTYISDENGKLLIQGLYAYESEKNIDQTYVLKEVLTPEGYAKVKDITFKVSNTSGVLDYEETLEDGQSSKEYTIEDNIVKLTVEDSPIFKLIKKDGETGELLPNTKFAIYNVDSSTVPARNSKGEIIGDFEIIDGKEYYTISTDSNGELNVDLPEGFYKIIEIQVSDEKYDIKDNKYYFGIGKSRENGIILNELKSGIVGNTYFTANIIKTLKTKDNGFLTIGTFYSDFSLDDGTQLTGYGRGNYTAFMIKYDKEGHTLWGNAYEGENYGSRYFDAVEMSDGDYCVIAARSHLGYSYYTRIRRYDVFGNFEDVIDNGTVPAKKIEKLSNDYLVLIKENKIEIYDDNYNRVVEKSINNIKLENLLVDDSDNIYIIGSSTETTINVDSESIINDSLGKKSKIILKFDSEGNLVSHSYILGDTMTINSACISEEKICLAGFFSEDIIVDNNSINSVSGNDAFLIEYDLELEKEFFKTYGNSGNESITFIDYDDTKLIIGLTTSSEELNLSEDCTIKKKYGQGTIMLFLDNERNVDSYYDIGNYYKGINYINRENDRYFVQGSNYSGYYTYPRLTIYQSSINTLTQTKDIIGIGNTGSDSIEKILATSDGGYIVGGKFNGTCRIDENHSIVGNGLIKFNKNSEVEWVKASITPSAIIEDDNNNFLIATSSSIRKYSKDGDLIWTKNISNLTINCIDESVDGNYLLGGSYRGEVDFGGNISLNNDITSGFFAEFDKDGICIRADDIRGSATTKITAIKGTIDNGVLLGGDSYADELEFRSDITLPNSTGYNDSFIVKYNSSRNCEWAKIVGEYSGNNYIRKIIEEKNGDIVVCGYSSNQNGKLNKYDHNGEILWENVLASEASNLTIKDIVKVSDGYLISGYFLGSSYNYGSIYVRNTGYENSWSTYEGIIIKTNEDGLVAWAKGIGDIKDDAVNAAVQLSDDTIVAGGYFSNSVLRDEAFEITNHGTKEEAFIIKLTEKKNASEMNVLEVNNNRKAYRIDTKIQKIDGISGGTISGEYDNIYEMVKYGEPSTKEIKMTPNENYEIIEITVNGEEWPFAAAADGTYTMPTFENMTEDKHIVVTYSLKDNKITINKKDSVSENALEGAKFLLDQLEERSEPDNNEIIGNHIDNGTIYTLPDYDKEIEGFIDLSTDLKYVEGVSYYFVSKLNEDNSISYVPTNSKTWQIENVEDATAGIQSTTANSYVELDLSGMTGTYKVVVNGYVSSQSNGDYGYATVSTNEDSIVNISSIPKYNSTSSTNSRFIYISGTTVDSTIPRDRESTIVLNGGQKYYLHLGYYKNASTDTGEDWFVINSIKLYETKDIQYGFEEKIIGEGIDARTVYESTNGGTYLKTANSCIPIDLTDYIGKYNLTVNADVSTTSGDYGYVTLNKTQSPAPSYSSNTSTNRRIIYKSGVANEEKTIEIDGGYKYYLHLGYYKDDVLNTSGEDYFRVNSINISLSDSELYHTTLETNSLGQAMTQIPFGKYQITELETQEEYVLTPKPIVKDQEGNIINESGIIEFRSTEGNLHEYTIENEKYAHVIVHHYLKDTMTKVADDEYLEGRQGSAYSTVPRADISNYELEIVNGEVVLPDNQTGEYTYDDIVVTYYYVRKKIPLTTNHLIEGTNVGVPLKAGGNAESIVEYGDENQGYTTAAIANELLDDRYELSQIPENSTGIYSGNEVIVNYYYKEIERTLTINKTGEDGVEPVSNAVFDVRNQNNTIFGNITNNGTIYTSLEYDSTNNKNLYLGNLTNNGTYYFVEDSEGKLVPTNSKKWRVENVDGATAGVRNVTANSYMKIDLTRVSGSYVVVINAHVSSQTSYDVGYATINQSETAPAYGVNNDTNKRFMYISGNTTTSLTDKDYVSSIFEGGKTYYLHLGYRKNGSTDTGDDQVVINSINLYPATEKHISYYFEYDNGKLVSNNQNKDNTVANSYLPIDLRGKTGDYELTVNAEVSSASGDYGYLTINKSTVAPAHGTNDTSNVRFAHTYNQAARDYSTTIAGGDLYYLHLGYYKNGSTSSGSDTFTINSIKIGDEEYVGGIVKTDSEGKASIDLKVGTYDVSEITAPLSYDLNTSVNTITVARDSGNQTLDITNRKTRGMVIVHHYLKDTTTPVPLENGGVAEDEIKEKIVGEMYATKELEGISREFECVGVVGETSGTYIDGTIEVTYYYDYKDSTVTVHHYIQGTTNSLSDDEIITGQITSYYETGAATDIPEYYELVAEPTNKEGYITYDPIEVIYEYKLKNYPYIVNYYKVGTTEKVADSKEDGTATYGTTVRAADNEEDVYGYKIVSYSDAEITIGTQNNVINIYYDVDETQTKELWYIVEYYIDGEIVENDTEREFETVQVLQPNVLQVKKEKINTVDKYEGYRAKNADSIPDEIGHKGVIQVYYVSTNLSYVVNYLEKDTDIIIKLPKTVSGLEEGTEIDATTEVVTLYGYTYDSIDTTTLTIEANTVNNINIYYTRNPAAVIIHHYKESTDEKLDEDQTLDGYYYDMYQTRPNNVLLQEYILVNNPSNASGYMMEDRTEVTYYYKSRYGNIIVQHLDYNTHEPVSPEYTRRGEINSVYHQDPDDVEDYVCVADSGNTDGVFWEEDITVTFYYLKEAKVTVNHIDKVKYDKLLEENPNLGDEDILRDCMLCDPVVKKGVVGDVYYSSQINFEGYELIEKPDNERVVMTEDEIILNYYYIYRSEGVLEKHVDIVNNTILENLYYEGHEGDTYDTDDSKSFETYEPVTNKQFLDKLDITEENYTDYGLTVDNYNSILENPNDRYIPYNKTGEMKKGLVEVIYYYIRPTKVEVHYIDKLTEETLEDSTIVIEGYEGDSYSSDAKEFEGYELVKNKDVYTDKELTEKNLNAEDNYIPDNHKGMMNVDEDGNNVEVVTYYYLRSSGGVTERHTDITTGDLIIDEKHHEGREGDYYTTSYETVETYRPVSIEEYYDARGEEIPQELDEEKDKYYEPSNAKGQMTVEEQIVEYYYIRMASVKVEYRNISNGDELPASLEEFWVENGWANPTGKVNNSSSEYIYGKDGDSYETKEKYFENFTIVKEKYPINAKGEMHITKKADGTYETETVVTYWYRQNAGGVSVVYEDKENGDILDSEYFIGQVDDEYETGPKEIDGYELIKNKDMYSEKELKEKKLKADDPYLPENYKGKMKPNQIEVIYYYKKTSKPDEQENPNESTNEKVIRNITNNYDTTNNYYDETNNFYNTTNNYYEQVDARTTPTTIVVTNGTKTASSDTQNNSQNTGIATVSTEKTTSVSNTTNKIDTTGKTPNTGDTAPVIASWVIIITIMANIVVIVLKKQE